MISSVVGVLAQVTENSVQLRVGPMVLELLVPASDHVELLAANGQELIFHTVFYLGGDPSRGALEPTLIGFLRAEDREFFNIFTTVKGIGSKTALRALAAPVGEIARAIEEKDARYLVGLNGIGKRTAELIVAELSGKVTRFAVAAATSTPGRPSNISRYSEAEEDAISALMALGDRRAEAERLLERAKQMVPEARHVGVIFKTMMQLRGG